MSNQYEKMESVSNEVNVVRSTKKSKSTAIAGLVVGLWGIAALVASQLNLFQAGDQPPIGLLLSVVLPLVLFGALYVGSKRFAQTVSNWSLRFLTWVQSTRVAGFAFIAYYAMGLLPAVFALPAGLGDILAGVTAPLVVRYVVDRSPLRKSLYTGWTIYGMGDLIDAILLGVLSTEAFSHRFNIYPTSNPSISTLPLSLIPTFGVPLLFILEILALIKVRHFNDQKRMPSWGSG